LSRLTKRFALSSMWWAKC